jgi:hypothetical protein
VRTFLQTMADGHNPVLDGDQSEPESQHMQGGAAETVNRKTRKKNKRAAEGAADSKAG